MYKRSVCGLAYWFLVWLSVRCGWNEEELWRLMRTTMKIEEVANAFACSFLTVVKRDTDSNDAVGVI